MKISLDSAVEVEVVVVGQDGATKVSSSAAVEVKVATKVARHCLWMKG